jgi:hypothetical protein
VHGLVAETAEPDHYDRATRGGVRGEPF